MHPEIKLVNLISRLLAACRVCSAACAGEGGSVPRLALFMAGLTRMMSVSSPLSGCSGPHSVSPQLPVNAQTLHKPSRFLDIDHTGPIKGEQFESVTSPINRPKKRLPAINLLFGISHLKRQL